MIRDGLGFLKLVRPLALYRDEKYMQAEELLRRRKIAGNYAIVPRCCPHPVTIIRAMGIMP